MNSLLRDLDLPFHSDQIAKIVYDVLRVDIEPKRSGVTKTISLNGSNINVKFEALLPKQLRVAVGNFLEKLDLVVETIQVFGPPVGATYNHY